MHESKLYKKMLKRARDLIEQGWTQNTYYARDKNGRALTTPYSNKFFASLGWKQDSPFYTEPDQILPEPTSFTIHGACTRAAMDIVIEKYSFKKHHIRNNQWSEQLYPRMEFISLEGLLRKRVGDTIVFNDASERTKEEVLTLFDEVIEELHD